MDTFKRIPGLIAIIMLVALVLLGVSTVSAQSDMEKVVKQFTDQSVIGYIQPIADMFGANMNSGYFHTAAIEQSGFHLSFDMIGMATMLSDGQKGYTATAPPGFNPATFQTATMFGGKGAVVTDAATGLSYRGSDGVFNTQVFPLAVPQLTLGNLYGTQVLIRYIPIPKMDNFPNVTLWGIGARHSISQYLPDVPVDLAAGIFYSSFTVGDFINYKGLAINGEASMSWSILTVYSGLQWEKSSMDLSYVSQDVSHTSVSVTMDGANTFRFILGVGLGLGPLKIFGDANFGSMTTFSAGFGFGG